VARSSRTIDRLRLLVREVELDEAGGHEHAAHQADEDDDVLSEETAPRGGADGGVIAGTVSARSMTFRGHRDAEEVRRLEVHGELDAIGAFDRHVRELRAPEDPRDESGGLDSLGVVVGTVRREAAVADPERRAEDGRRA
jgi:hypothetical protein